MKSFLKAMLLCVALGASLAVNAAQVGVSAGQTWIGFMNVFDLPSDGGAIVSQQYWAPADLSASFAGDTLTLTPNTSIPTSFASQAEYDFWWKADGTGNKNMDANIFVVDDSLAGETVTFSGMVLSNTLASPYVSYAFIRDFTSDFSSFTGTTVALVDGQAFSVTYATTAGHHVEYGFETLGPNARIDGVASLGSVQVTPIPEPSTYALMLAGLAAVGVATRRRGTG